LPLRKHSINLREGETHTPQKRVSLSQHTGPFPRFQLMLERLAALKFEERVDQIDVKKLV
jgi:hypothetical protein